MVKGVNFSNYRDTGDPVYCARVYNAQAVDELIFLDIDATNEQRPTNISVIDQIAKECFMPLSIGGGINSIAQIKELLRAGADKVVINTAAILNPGLLESAAGIFGSQCIIVGIDVRKVDGQHAIFSHSGKTLTTKKIEDYLREVEKAGAGEIFINSIDRDGTMQGYDNELISLVMDNTSLPVISSGGAGNFMHLVDTFKATGVGALAMASIFHFGDNNPIRARSYLKNNDINIKIT